MAKRRKPKLKIRIRNLGKERAWGLNWAGLGLVELDERCRPKFFLNSANHELIHELDSSLTEAQVCRYAKFLTDHIWALGYRRVYDENKPMKPKLKTKKKKN